MTSADCSARTVRNVSSSGSPGPAPTSVTLPAPAAVAWSFALRIASKSDDAGSRSGLFIAKPAKARQNRRRPDDESPEDCTALRQWRAASAQRAKPRGIIASSLLRIAWPKTGAAPSVEMPMTSGERLTMAPKEKSQYAGRSITLTGTPAARAASAKRSASASSSKPPTATAAPAKSSIRHGRCCSTIAARAACAATARSSSHGRSA